MGVYVQSVCSAGAAEQETQRARVCMCVWGGG